MQINYTVAFTVLKSPPGLPPLLTIPVCYKSSCQVSHSHNLAELPCPFSVLTPLLQQQPQLIPATSWKPLLTWLPGPCSLAHLPVGSFTEEASSPLPHLINVGEPQGTGCLHCPFPTSWGSLLVSWFQMPSVCQCSQVFISSWALTLNPRLMAPTACLASLHS